MPLVRCSILASPSERFGYDYLEVRVLAESVSQIRRTVRDV
jgi:hypothetical protein